MYYIPDMTDTKNMQIPPYITIKTAISNCVSVKLWLSDGSTMDMLPACIKDNLTGRDDWYVQSVFGDIAWGKEIQRAEIMFISIREPETNGV